MQSFGRSQAGPWRRETKPWINRRFSRDPGDRELLAELARLNGDMASLGMHIIEGSASAAKQAHYAQRLIATAERLDLRAKTTGGAIIEGDVLTEKAITLPEHSVESNDEPQTMHPEKET